MKSRHKIWLIVPMLLIALAGCASNIPAEIRHPVHNSPSVAEVRTTPARFEGSTVRWGGHIAGIENLEDETWVEIVSRNLYDSGRPVDNDHSSGRFIARIPEFLDPAVYHDNREVTVYGVLGGTTQKQIDQYNYTYPIVNVQTFNLWPRINNTSYGYRPYWYDPWYYPYPWYYRHPRHYY